MMICSNVMIKSVYLLSCVAQCSVHTVYSEKNIGHNFFIEPNEINWHPQLVWQLKYINMDTNGMKSVPLYSGLAHCARLTMGCCPVCPQSNNSKGSCSFALPWHVGQGLPPSGDPC